MMKKLKNIENYSGEVFNVGGGENLSISLKELTERCQKITGNSIPIGKIPEEVLISFRPVAEHLKGSF